MVFRAVVFTFLPTVVELVLVCGLLARTFTPIVSALVVGTFAAYVAWTAALTRAAAEVLIPSDCCLAAVVAWWNVV
jgi:ABC transporter ATM